MRLRWTARAIRDLASLHAYIEADSPTAAAGQVERILSSVATSSEFPYVGRRGRRMGTRELIVPRTPFIVAYKVGGEVIDLIAVLHGRRRWPESFRA